MDIIVQRAVMLGQLVDDIMLILEAETQPPDPEPVPIGELALEVVKDFQVAARQSKIGLQAEISSRLPPIRGSRAYIRRVLDNLIGNALKFTPAGGAVTVHLEHQKNGHVVLEVNDTGIGIPADQLDQIFTRFYQIDGSSKRRYGGVGLGLSLVKQAVEAYGGEVTVDSEPGQGSSFTVSLPIFEEIEAVEGVRGEKGRGPK